MQLFLWLVTLSFLSAGLGISMATSSPSLGMQYVDPSPIATHVVASEALEGTGDSSVILRQ